MYGKIKKLLNSSYSEYLIFVIDYLYGYISVFLITDIKEFNSVLIYIYMFFFNYEGYGLLEKVIRKKVNF